MNSKIGLIWCGILMLALGCFRSDSQITKMNNQTCPVTGEAVNDKDTYVHKGKEYKLCGEKCKRTLCEDPDKYLSDP